MHILESLNEAVDSSNSLLCVGLDIDPDKIPEHLRDQEDAIFMFNKTIIDATADLVCAYKPNSAFYEALGDDGLGQIRRTVAYIKKNYPGLVVIDDAKRADIDNTNNGYVKSIFGYIGADAVTVQPYMGGETLSPFLEQKDKGVIVLCRTTNKGSDKFQMLDAGDGEKIYQRVARNFSTTWNKNGNVMLVVGAVFPKELQIVREIVGAEMPLLVPGIGAQNGSVAEVMQAGLGSRKRGLIVNASRSIIYASDGEDFAEAARSEASRLRDEINQHR